MSVVVMIEGDKRYLDALSAVARKHNTTMGKLLRKTMDDCYGDEIEQALSFFGESVQQNRQSSGETDKPIHGRKVKATP